MGKDSDSGGKKLALGALFGALAGFITGILTAPKSGKETRHEIKEAAGKGLAEAEKQLKKLHTEIVQLIDEAKKRGSELTGRAKQELDSLLSGAAKAKERLRDSLSSVHEGDVADDDLKKAIKEAEQAVAYLKKYLGK